MVIFVKTIGSQTQNPGLDYKILIWILQKEHALFFHNYNGKWGDLIICFRLRERAEFLKNQ